jgi:hypothetical protein
MPFFWDTKPCHWVSGSRHFEATSIKAPWTVTSDTPLPKSSKLAHLGPVSKQYILPNFANTKVKADFTIEQTMKVKRGRNSTALLFIYRR